MIIHLNHNDLDAMGCHFVLKKQYSDIHQYNTPYSKIEDNLEIIHDKLSYDKTIDKMYITDLSFNQAQYSILMGIVREFPNTHFIFIDHHPVMFDVEATHNLLSILDTSKSATKLCAEYFGMANEFIEAVNAFDTWDKNSKYFKYGFMLNTLFWGHKQKSFTYAFKSMGKPTARNIEDYEEIKQKKNKHFEGLRKKGLLMNDNGVLISFTDKHLNWIQIDYPNEEFYVNATSYGTINVRIGDVVPEEEAGHLKEILSTSLQTEDWFVDMGGHPRAFGVSHKGSNDHIIIVECVRHIFEEVKKLKESA